LLMEHANQQPPDLCSILQVCRKFGDEQPSLWVRAFRLLLKLPFDSDRFESNINDDFGIPSELTLQLEPTLTDLTAEQVLISVLKQILVKRLLSLSSVIQSMADNVTIPITALHSHLDARLLHETSILHEQKALVIDHERETQRTRQLLQALQTQPIVLQASKCALCGHSLELPAIHFLCLHAFHRQCFDSHSGEHDQACPLCLPEQRRLQRLLNISGRTDRTALQKQFVQQLLESPSSPISVVARFFSQRVFD
jgi:hypothetical protein